MALPHCVLTVRPWICSVPGLGDRAQHSTAPLYPHSVSTGPLLVPGLGASGSVRQRRSFPVALQVQALVLYLKALQLLISILLWEVAEIFFMVGFVANFH